ncbi:MAG: MaoC family dehydratase [Ectobacillus sp.]
MKSVSFVVTAADVELYGEVSGDRNPIHFDKTAAMLVGFAERPVHGMLTMGKILASVSSLLPSSSFIQTYDVTFMAPVYVGEEVTVELHQKQDQIQIACWCNDRKVVKGRIQIGEKPIS